MAERAIRIGVVGAVNPGRRELRIRRVTSRAKEFADMDWVTVVLDGEEVRCKVTASKVRGEFALVTLAAGVTRDRVAQMKGAPVVVSVQDERPRATDEFDAEELLELTVRTETGERLGEVVAAFETPANAVVEIDRDGEGSMLLPVVKEVVVRVDWDQGELIVGDVTPFAVENGSDTQRA